jgi:hypothetical protein
MNRRLPRACLVPVVLTALAGAAPASAAQADGRVRGAADSVLTVDALTRLMTFWKAFAKEQDDFTPPLDAPASLLAIDTVYSGSRIVRMELVLNMAALAAEYSSVAGGPAAGRSHRRALSYDFRHAAQYLPDVQCGVARES